MDYLNGQVLPRLTAWVAAGPTSSRAADTRSVRQGWAESRRCALSAQPMRKARAVHRRELAVRVSGRTHVRLLWRQGTPQLCVEVRESNHWSLAIQVQPEKARDAFHHPYGYAGSRGLRHPVREHCEP